MRFELNRRRFTQMLGTAAAAAPVLLSLKAQAADGITVLNWQGYGTDEDWALKIFTEKTGIKVTHEYYSAESEMVTKLQTNPGAYDVVVVNSARSKQLGPDLLQPVDFAAIPNSKDLAGPLKTHPNFVIDGKPYGCVWLWGITGLAAREGKARQGDSLAILADPAFVDRVAMDDDPIIAIGVGALMSGQDINAPKDIGLAADKLKSLKKNIRLLWQSEDQWDKAFAADQFDLSIFWSGASVRSRRNFKLPVDFLMAKEGGIGWIDTLAIPKTSTKAAAAARFIDFMIDPDFYYEWATKVGAPASANLAAMGRLPADDLNRLVHKTEYLATLQFMGPLADDTRSSFVDTWEEVKAFYAS